MLASHTLPRPGTWPATLACALQVCRLAPSPLSHPSQSLALLLLCQNALLVRQMLLILQCPANWAPLPGSLS